MENEETIITVEKRSVNDFLRRTIIWGIIISAIITMVKFNLEFLALAFYLTCFWFDYWKFNKKRA